MNPAATGIHVRQLQIDLTQGFARHWNGGDAYRTHLFNALSLLFPRGEQAFIDSVRGVLPVLQQAGREDLLAEARLFIGQEATHRHLHQQFNDELARQGYKSRVENYLKTNIEWSQAHLQPLTLLAFTVAYEHFTAVLGDGLLRHPGWTRDMHPAMRELWLWHAAEETEHKAVAFDAYLAAGGKRRMLALAFVVVFLEFFLMTAIQTASMLLQDRRLFAPATWWSAAKLWFGRDGVAWHLMRHLPSFLRPRFHPWQQDNRDLLERWRAAHAMQYRVVRSA